MRRYDEALRMATFERHGGESGAGVEVRTGGQAGGGFVAAGVMLYACRLPVYCANGC